MKNRNRQRENHRLRGVSLSESPRLEKPWLNQEGYHDPTAYQAFRNIERREARVGSKPRSAQNPGRHQAPVADIPW